MIKPTISIIVPALNEEKNILLTIDNALSALKEFGISGEIIVANDGSTDSTSVLVAKKMKENSGIIKMISHDKPKGIGASFWDGVDIALGDVVVMIPGDNENDPRGILRHYGLIEEVGMVIPFILNKEARSFFRRIVSSLYRIVINASFATNFKYTNGTTLYRKAALQQLNHRSKGFFFQTDIMVRLNKGGYLFAEVPCRLGLRKEGASKAITFASLAGFIKEYLRLVRDCYFLKKR